MTINFETLSKFVREHDAVTIIDTSGKSHVLRSGDADVFDVIEKADRFIFRNKGYTRDQFAALLDAPAPDSAES